MWNDIFHDELFEDADLAMAGELVVSGGILEVVTDESGHYRPPRLMMTQFLAWLNSHVIHPLRIKQIAPE